jgi:FkbM family methyltransferase
VSTLATTFRLAAKARAGAGVRGKWLAFLVAGLVSLGGHRARARAWFLRQIGRQARQGLVTLRVRVNGKPIALSMRAGDMDDYRIAGELVRGPYQVPGFTPANVVDGGANIGMFALYAGAHFPNARITCYEPGDANHALLVRNLATNGSKAEARKLGLWSRDITLYFHPSTSYAGTVSEEPSEYPIPCVLPEIGPDCWLKLDIEGSEYEVLPALVRAGRLPRWITMEVHDYARRGGRELLEMLRANGYAIEGDDRGDEGLKVITAERRAGAGGA